MSALRDCSIGGMTDHELVNATGLPPSVVCAELDVLRKAGLVESQRREATDFHQTCLSLLHTLASTTTDASAPPKAVQEEAPAGGDQPHGRGRPRGPSNTKARIVTAAGYLVPRSGFDALSLAAVADAAGVTRPTISYHFPSKTALYRAVLAQARNGIDRAAATTGFSIHGERVSTRLSEFVTRIMKPGGDWSAAAFLPGLAMDCSRHPDVLADGTEILGLVRAFLTSSMTTVAPVDDGDGDPTEFATAVEATMTFLLGLGVYANLWVPMPRRSEFLTIGSR